MVEYISEETNDLIAGGSEPEVDGGEENVKEEVCAALEAVISIVTSVTTTVKSSEDEGGVVMSDEKEEDQVDDENAVNIDEVVAIVVENKMEDEEELDGKWGSEEVMMTNDKMKKMGGEEGENREASGKDIDNGIGNSKGEAAIVAMDKVKGQDLVLEEKEVYWDAEDGVETDMALTMGSNCKNGEADGKVKESDSSLMERGGDSGVEMPGVGRKRKRDKSQSRKPPAHNIDTQMSPEEIGNDNFPRKYSSPDEKFIKRRKLEYLSTSQSWISVSVQVSPEELSATEADGRSSDETTFKCPYCLRLFSEGPRGLIQHLTEHNNSAHVLEKDATDEGSKSAQSTEAENATKWNCSDCAFGSNDVSKFVDHVSTHIIKPKVHRCVECSASFRYSIQLNKHINKAHPKNDTVPEQVPVSDEPTGVEISSKAEKIDLTPARKTLLYNCTGCSSSFEYSIQLKKHVQRAYPKNGTVPDMGPKPEPLPVTETPSSITNQDSTAAAKQHPYKCTECSSSFKYKIQLAKHGDKVHSKKDIEPDPEKSAEENLASNGSNVSPPPPTALKTLPCKYSECKSSFKYKIQLAKHIDKAHPTNDDVQDDKPVEPAVVELSNDLESKSTDTSKPKFHKCTECSASFKLNVQLKKHVISAHSKKDVQVLDKPAVVVAEKSTGSTANAPYKCDKCSRSFKYIIQLTKHVCKVQSKKNAVSDDPEPEDRLAMVDLSSDSSDIFEPVAVTKRKTAFPKNVPADAPLEACKNKDKEKHSCNKCGQDFLSAYFLMEHKCRQSKSNSVRCSSCDKMFCSASSLKRHEKRFHRSKKKAAPVKSTAANQSESASAKVLRAKAKLDPSKQVTRCEKNATKKRQRSPSSSSTSSTKSDSTDSIKKDMRTSMKDGFKSLSIQMQRKGDRVRYKCMECSKTFNSRDNAAEHAATHSEKEVSSPEEGRRRGRSQQKKNKTDSDSEPNLYKCHVCSKVFNRYSNLQQHLLTHSQYREKKSHKCGKCHKAFSDLTKLRAHMAEAHPPAKKRKR